MNENQETIVITPEDVENANGGFGHRNGDSDHRTATETPDEPSIVIGREDIAEEASQHNQASPGGDNGEEDPTIQVNKDDTWGLDDGVIHIPKMERARPTDQTEFDTRILTEVRAQADKLRSKGLSGKKLYFALVKEYNPDLRMNLDEAARLELTEYLKVVHALRKEIEKK